MPTERPWAVVFVNGAAHLLPVYDTFEHEAWECWCWPTTKVYVHDDGESYLAHIHNAEDCREFDEMAGQAETTWH